VNRPKRGKYKITYPSNEDYKLRIMSQVDIDPVTGCWLWKGYLWRNGYGRMRYRSKKWAVHRLNYMLHLGEIPDGLMACHCCDVKSCCNPLHIFLGDQQANMDDMSRKGRSRHARGETHHSAKLTKSQVDEIRRRYVHRMGASLGREFGVSQAQISRIVLGRTWSPDMQTESR
jgi:hypothetical protein